MTHLLALNEATAIFLALDRIISLPIDLSEALFKHAVLTKNIALMESYLSSGALIGQSILAFLSNSHMDASLVLPFLKDAATRYKVALDAGLYELSFSALLDLEEKELKEHEASVALYEANKISKKFVKSFPSSSLRSYFKTLGESALFIGKFKLARESLIKSGQSESVFLLPGKPGIQ